MSRERAEKRLSALESRSHARPEPSFPYAAHPPLEQLEGLSREWYSALARYAGYADHREIPSTETGSAVRAVRTHDPELFERLSEALLILGGADDEENLTDRDRRRLEELDNGH